MNSASVLVGSDLSARFLAEEFGDCFLRIAFNYQSLLLRTRFTLSALRLWFFGHLALLSHCTHLVPEPGIGPGRPEWARDCKSRLSASSSTRGPQAIGPFSAALRYLANNSERNILVSDGRRFPFVINPAFFFLSLDFSRFFKPTDNLVTRRPRSYE